MYKLEEEQFDEAYHIMQASFPQSELRPYQKMKELFINEKLFFYGIEIKNKLFAVIIVWEFKDFVFLENFAVLKNQRGKGLGSKSLADLKTLYDKKIVLEVEKPFDKASRKRISFYEKNGFILTDFGYMQPPLNEEINEVPLVMMSFPNPLNESEFEEMKQDIFKEVFEVR